MVNRHIRAPRCLSVYFIPTFFYLRSTCLILIKPILECEKQPPPYFQEVSVSPRLKGYWAVWSGEAWFRGSDRSIEWAMWELFSKAILRGPEVIRQTSRSGYFQCSDENPLLSGRCCRSWSDGLGPCRILNFFILQPSGVSLALKEASKSAL